MIIKNQTINSLIFKGTIIILSIFALLVTYRVFFPSQKEITKVYIHKTLPDGTTQREERIDDNSNFVDKMADKVSTGLGLKNEEKEEAKGYFYWLTMKNVAKGIGAIIVLCIGAILTKKGYHYVVASYADWKDKVDAQQQTPSGPAQTNIEKQKNTNNQSGN